MLIRVLPVLFSPRCVCFCCRSQHSYDLILKRSNAKHFRRAELKGTPLLRCRSLKYRSRTHTLHRQLGVL